MFDYLQQFNSLPKDLRDRVSSPLVMAAVTNLENKYKVDLAMTIMKVMVKSLTIKSLPLYFVDEMGLAPDSSENLTRELKEQVFAGVAEHLGLKAEMRALDLERDIEILIKEAGLVMASANLVSRFKNILATYLRGVRSKIDTRNTLAKDVKIGGLNLSPAEIERVLKICDSGKFKNTDTPVSRSIVSAPIKPAIFVLPPEEYDLKRALASGETKSIVKAAPAAAPKIENKIVSPIDVKHELEAPDRRLDLASPVTPLALAPAAPTEKPASSAIKIAQSAGLLRSFAPVKPPIVVAPSENQGQAENLIKTADPLKPVASNKISPASRPIEIPQKAEEKKEEKKEEKREEKKIETAVAPSAPVVGVSKLAAAPVSAVSPTKGQTPVAAAEPIAARRPATSVSSARPQMHDIKPVPKVMGPIEELQFLDVVNFRRLGKTPAEATAKIFAKIKLLEQDGYDKMVKGIKAWRQSPVNHLYLRLGQEAVNKGVPFKEAITMREKSGQEYLNMEEVEALLSLNSKLVF